MGTFLEFPACKALEYTTQVTVWCTEVNLKGIGRAQTDSEHGTALQHSAVKWLSLSYWFVSANSFWKHKNGVTFCKQLFSYKSSLCLMNCYYFIFEENTKQLLFTLLLVEDGQLHRVLNSL